VQYVLNTLTNPRVAEEQRIQQLTDYIQKQLTAGYPQQTIANFLTSRGYPYFEVNSALQQATQPKAEPKTEHRLVVFAIIAMLMMTGAVTFLYFKSYVSIGAPPEKLLDVQTEQLTAIVQQGGELNFQVSLINFGYERRFDVILRYKVLDRETQQVVLEKEETVALSTTLERVVSFSIPASMKEGRYVLRTDAIYEDFTATSGFIFDVLPKGLAQEKIDEIKRQMQKVNETDIPELGPETPPEQQVKSNETPTGPVEVKPAEEQTAVESAFYEGKTKEDAFEYVKAVSSSDADKAITLCKSYKYAGNAEQCLQMLSEYHKDGKFCAAIDRGVQRDNCYVEAARETKDYSMCDGISNPQVKSTCEMFSTIEDAQKLQTQPEADQQDMFSLIVRAQEPLAAQSGQSLPQNDTATP
jgi:hypothetical protein